MTPVDQKQQSKNKTIAIVGRPNVGKSTLFNRLMGRMTKAITHNTPGVTRDRQYGIKTFEDQRGRPLNAIMVDTGGLFAEELNQEKNNQRVFDDIKKVRKKSHYYPGQDEFYFYIAKEAIKGIDEADLILLVVDGLEGLTPYDESLVSLIREKKKDFWLIVNKMESEKNLQEGRHLEFFQTGINEEQMIPISAAHGRGIFDLEYNIGKYLRSFIKVDPLLEEGELSEDDKTEESQEDFWGKLAIIGAPNSGKSTLMNRLLKKDRSLVSPLPGTTVDPVTDYFELFLDDEEGGAKLKKIQIVDTAGIRKQSAIKKALESESVFRSLRSMTDADVILHVVDIEKGLTHQDRRLIDIATEKGKSLILILNKIDLVPEFKSDRKKLFNYIEEVKKGMPFNLSIFPLSAKDGDFIKLLKKMIGKTVNLRKNKIPTGKLNTCIQELVKRNQVMLKGSSRAVPFKIKYATILKMEPPTILLFCNRGRDIPTHYRRFLTNGIKEYFNLKNTPVHLIFRTIDSAKEKRATMKKEKVH